MPVAVNSLAEQVYVRAITNLLAAGDAIMDLRKSGIGISILVCSVCVSLFGFAQQPSFSAPSGHNANSQGQKKMLPCLSVLMTTKIFADGVRGESPDLSPGYKAFLEAYGLLPKISNGDLQHLVKNATPAGKLYAAALLRVKGELPRSECYASLLSDQSSVDYQSGCRLTTAKVSEIAKQLLDSDKYLNFTPGVYCTVPGPIKSLEKTVIEHPVVGSTRADLSKHFTADGGLSVPFKKERYFIPNVFDAQHRVKKFDIKFKPAGMTDAVYYLGKWVSPPQNDLDTVMEFSAPYYEQMHFD